MPDADDRFIPLLAAAVVPAFIPIGTVQAPRVLDKPQVELAEPFTNVGSVRELSDGRVKGGKLATVDIIIPPLPAQDGWQPFPDGAVAIARERDYRVDWVLPDGRRVSGQPIPFSPVRVTQRDKDQRPKAAAAADNWPEVKPPFAANGVLAGADGRVWIQRYGPATDTRTHYDVVDRRGIVAQRVDVPNAGRIVGFGTRPIYVVRKDADDLQYLQRFAL